MKPLRRGRVSETLMAVGGREGGDEEGRCLCLLRA
jgi:hypothetical protein